MKLSNEPIQVYPSDFGAGVKPGKPSKRVRRMSKRKVKRHLAKELALAWDAAVVKGME